MIALPGVKGMAPSRVIIILVASCLSIMMLLNMGGQVHRPTLSYGSWTGQGSLSEQSDSPQAAVVANVYNNTLGVSNANVCP